MSDAGSSIPIRPSVRRVLSAIAGTAAAAAVLASPATSSPEHPCRLPGFSSVTFVEKVSGEPPRLRLSVRNARVICGGPDDEHWDPIGATHTVALPASAKIRLIPSASTTARPATPAQFIRLTRLQSRDTSFGWFGGAYGVRTSSSGQIASLTELFHP